MVCIVQFKFPNCQFNGKSDDIKNAYKVGNISYVCFKFSEGIENENMKTRE